MEKGDYVKIRAGRNEGAFGTIKGWDTDARDGTLMHMIAAFLLPLMKRLT